ncbi:AAA family ATPase [Herbaspirillum huttiense]|uniref:AAA family ATPase n=1 Tax=Herbaspirillum huttiense TaxID=863372 RepID=UPI0039AEAD1B
MTLAVYSEKDVHPSHLGNPLILALRPSMSDVDASTALMVKPDLVVSEERKLPPHVRVHGVAAIADIFIPTQNTISLYSRVDIELKRALRRKSPFLAETQRRLDTLQETASDAWKQTEGQIGKAVKSNKDPLQEIGAGLPNIRSILVVGPSGKGKSTSVRRVLMANSQVIEHLEFEGKIFRQKQLVWLSVQAPINASISGLCESILQAIDRALGLSGDKSYSKQYTGKRLTNDVLIAKVAQVLASHYLGILHIDDLQRIAEGTKANISALISFIMQLSDVVGSPLVLSGTPKLVGILSRSVEVARRCCSAGMEELTLADEYIEKGNFDLLMNGLFKFQLLPKDCESKEKVTKVILERSQDITAVAVSLFIHAQIIGLRTGKESLDSDLIEQAYEGLRPLHVALDALRRKDHDALSKYEDIVSVNDALKLAISGGAM